MISGTILLDLDAQNMIKRQKVRLKSFYSTNKSVPFLERDNFSH